MSFLMALRSCSRLKVPISSSYQVFNKIKNRGFATSPNSIPKEEEIDENKPLPYLTSNAATWKAESSRTYGSENSLWYQPYVVIFSVASFLIYFCILREENDVDADLGMSLYARIPGLEKQQLLQLYEYNIKNGVDVTSVEERLKEILREERSSKQN